MFFQNDQLFLAPEENILKRAKGNFAKQIFVFVLSEPEHPGNAGFLKKILAAAGLDLDTDALLVEVSSSDRVSFLPAVKDKHAGHILVFGLSPKQLGLHAEIPAFLPYPFYGATFLFADKLSVLEPDKTLKAKLWQALRQLFL